MSFNALYTDLSGYYDLMCAEIDYQSQSESAARLNQIFGNGGKRHLDLACGTGPHIQYLLQKGYECSGLDINQPMLDIAQQRCPTAQFSAGNMCNFSIAEPYDFISCFLYSIHYSGSINNLKSCIESAYRALSDNGVLLFNAVDKTKINNDLFEQHSIDQGEEHFIFRSAWHYSGSGEKQSLNVYIEKRSGDQTLVWNDEHPMVAVSFLELKALLEPYFAVEIFEHDYQKIEPWNQSSGNAIFVCIKR